MSVFAQSLILAKYASTTLTTEYTSTSVTTIVDKFTATNISGGAVTVTIYIVPSGGTSGDSNMIIKTLSVAAGVTTDIEALKNQVLGPGEFIRVLASAAESLVIRASGRRVT